MKKLALAFITLSMVATPVFACPMQDHETADQTKKTDDAAKTADKSKDTKAPTAAKAADKTKDQKPAAKPVAKG